MIDLTEVEKTVINDIKSTLYPKYLSFCGFNQIEKDVNNYIFNLLFNALDDIIVLNEDKTYLRRGDIFSIKYISNFIEKKEMYLVDYGLPEELDFQYNYIENSLLIPDDIRDNVLWDKEFSDELKAFIKNKFVEYQKELLLSFFIAGMKSAAVSSLKTDKKYLSLIK